MAEPVVHARARASADLLPIRMCNEFVYCPRLFHLEHVQGIFIESADTIEGSAQHARAKKRGRRFGVAPTSDDAPAECVSGIPRSLAVESESYGVTGKIDFVEVNQESVIVVETKRGRAPASDEARWGDHAIPVAVWPADLAQVGLYMAVLREYGLPCDEGHVLYRESNVRRTVPWSAALERFLLDVVSQARATSRLPCPPDPLIDSPKCVRCSLHEACLPDEHHVLVAQAAGEPTGDVRRIVAGRDDRAVLHATTPGTVIRKDGDSLVACLPSGVSERVPLKDLQHVALFGRVQLTQPCLTHLIRTGIPVSHHTGAGRLVGMTTPLSTVNIVVRRAQYRTSDDPRRSLEAARAFVLAKIRNQRTILRRYRRGTTTAIEEEAGGDLPGWAGGASPDALTERVDAMAATGRALRRMQVALRAAERAEAVETLRGYEGEAANQYFAALPSILPAAWRGDFGGRSRRPPRDRVNAMLSFGYALLVRETTAALARVGLDPMLGLYHTVIPGRPALALDLMEPFRPAWVDTSMLRLLATGGIERDDFHCAGVGVSLSARGRRRVIRAYERRGDELTTHPRFGYRMSYRRIVELEARVLAKWLVGEIDALEPLWTR